MTETCITQEIRVAVLQDCDVRLIWFTPEVPYFVFVDVCKAVGLPASSDVLRSLPMDTTGVIREDSCLVKAAYVMREERAIISAAGLAHLVGAASRDLPTGAHGWKPAQHPHYSAAFDVLRYENATGDLEIYKVAA